MAKRRKIFSAYLLTFPYYSLRTFQKKSGSGQVRSPNRVGWLHLRIVCNHVRARVLHGAISSLQVFITVPVCVMFISQHLYICDLRSGQSRDLYIPSLWEVIKRVLLRVNSQNHPILWRLWQITWSVMTQVVFTDGAPERVTWGHVGSSIVFSPLKGLSHLYISFELR